jgi:hypothetical protein
MTNAAIRVHAPRAITFTRSKRARRFWRSMDAALRCTARARRETDEQILRKAG